MDVVGSILALRSHVAHPPTGGTANERFVREFETELARIGWLLTPELRYAVARIPEATRLVWADWLLATLQGDLGADRAWVPLYRRFPNVSSRDTDQLFMECMLVHHFQRNGMCSLCAGFDTVAPVAPCGHLVCRKCFPPDEYSACPICRRRLDPTDPFMVVPQPSETSAGGAPVRWRTLDLGRGRQQEAIARRDALAGRATPLAENEQHELEILIVATVSPGDLGWATAVPSRETNAIIAAQALRTAPAEQRGTVVSSVAERWQTATDIARTLWTYSGGAPRLVIPRGVKPVAHWTEQWRAPDQPPTGARIPRVAPLSRPLRAGVLATLDRFPMPTVIEDVLRHSTVWKRIAERLHPFEHAARYPRAAVVFVVLRQSRHAPDSAVGRAILAAADAGWVRILPDTGRGIGARIVSFAGIVEERLRDVDPVGALDMLRRRPGELLRRLDHLARLWDGDPSPLVDAARQAAAKAAPAVVLSTMASLTGRDQIVSGANRLAAVAAQQFSFDEQILVPVQKTHEEPSPDSDPLLRPELTRAQRVFFPKGGTARVWAARDDRPLLPTGLPELLRSACRESLHDRAATLDQFDLAIIDVGLRDVPLPLGAQNVSGGNQLLPRGSMLNYPESEVLRLFLHWIEPDDRRVDLDLSVMLFDQDWNVLDFCDYTKLDSRYGATHSGDFQSAPAPMGAAEFIDLDLSTLRGSGVVWVVPIVFSYSDFPFHELPTAIAGVGRPYPGRHFDPAGVMVRYDLTGNSKTSMPFVANVVDGSVRWLDVNLGVIGYGHSVRTQGRSIAFLVANLEALYSGTSRANSCQLALTHARARSAAVVFRDGELYSDDDGNPIAAPELSGRRVLVACVDEPPSVDDAAEGSVVYSVLGADVPSRRPITDLLGALVLDQTHPD